MRKSLLVLALALVSACFDSLVSDPCASGYQLVAGECTARFGPDASPGDLPDASPGGTDADPGSADGAPGEVVDPGLVCEAPLVECDGACRDLSADPDNCGACGRACASGICEASHCVGTLSGHIVAIGHDYQDHHAAMRRVLGNAIALAAAPDLAVARLRGTASAAAHAGTTSAITQGMAELGRAWHEVAAPELDLDGVDALVVEAQTGDGDAAQAAGAAWAGAIDGLLQRGGVVIVLEGAGGVGHRFAAGANLFTTDAPQDATGLHAIVADPGDAVAQQVVSPYLTETTSATFPGLTGPVVTPLGTLVVHQTRY